ncbi:agmatinase [Chloroflexota bacterium]
MRIRRVSNANLEPGMVALLGVPYDENSSFLAGPALSPDRIRETLLSGESSLCTEHGADLGSDSRFVDLGNLSLDRGLEAREQIAAGIAGILDDGVRILSLGGDHAVSYPVLKAYHRHWPRLNVLHFDAHPDLYDELDGNRYSHACPFARAMEECLVARLVQVGIRNRTVHQREQAERFGVETVEAAAWETALALEFDGPVYLSVDLDVLDPAFAPGVSHHEPGGLTSRELIRILHSVRAPVVGADIVELNPHRDPVGITAALAAKLVKEIAGIMLRQEEQRIDTGLQA